jgi:5-keto-L-gluconate epimerase
MLELSISLSPTRTLFGPLIFSGDLEKGLTTAKGLGYKFVELSMLDSAVFDQTGLIKRIRELGLKVSAIATGQTYYNDGYSIFNIDGTMRSKVLERIKGHIDFASKLGSSVILGGIRGKLEQEPENRKIQVEKGKEILCECASYALDREVKLLLEPINRYETNMINTVREGIDLIEELGYVNLKILPDTFHMNIEEVSFEESISMAVPYLEYIHFADSNRYAPGQGHIQFDRIISFLKKVNFDGIIGIEILPKPDDFKAASQAIDFLKELIARTGN